MALPTAATFKARHPRFAAVADVSVDLYIAEAGRTVDETIWAASDYADGCMYLAAHMMEIEGARAPTGKTVGTAGAIKKAKAGDVEVEYQPMQMSGDDRSDALYGSTIYGRRYMELAARNGGVTSSMIMVV